MRNIIDHLCIIAVILLPAFMWVVWSTPPSV